MPSALAAATQCVAIEQVLLRQIIQLTRLDSEARLSRCRGTESVITATLALILNWSNDVPLPPVYFSIRVAKLGHHPVLAVRFLQAQIRVLALFDRSDRVPTLSLEDALTLVRLTEYHALLTSQTFFVCAFFTAITACHRHFFQTSPLVTVAGQQIVPIFTLIAPSSDIVTQSAPRVTVRASLVSNVVLSIRARVQKYTSCSSIINRCRIARTSTLCLIENVCLQTAGAERARPRALSAPRRAIFTCIL